ncbi:MAG: hypothetical protein ACK5LP_05150 [Campylobacteraceae bacterium]
MLIRSSAYLAKNALCKQDIDGKTIVIKDGKVVAGLPVNATYVQFPDDPTPSSLFGGTWELKYANEGIFFRTEGGNALAFGGGVQQDAIRDIVGSFGPFTNTTGGHATTTGIYTLSATSGTAYGGGGGRGDGSYIESKASNTVPTATENRPINRTIRVWKRIS